MTKKQTSWIINIPECHPSLNRLLRMHWTARNKLTEEWNTMVFYAAKEAGLPHFTEPVEMFITYYHPKLTVDLDNFTPKLICDSLKQFFIDDNIQHLKKLGWQFKKGEKRSVVEISIAK